MGLIRFYVQAKENLNLKIAIETERLYLDGLSYLEAFKKAKEIYKLEG